MIPTSTIRLRSLPLIPAEWSDEAPGHVAVFNPALVRFRERLLMAYRVVGADRRRRIAICALDQHTQPIAETIVPLSDFICDAGDWHADPRFLVAHDRLFVHFNDNTRQRPNNIYILELDPDTLHPLTAARPLTLLGPRQEIEKNWMLFEHEGDFYAIYSIAPHQVLRVDLRGRGPVHCTPCYTQNWDIGVYSRRYGEPRGGAPPVRDGDVYYSVFHSSEARRISARLYTRIKRLPPRTASAMIRLLRMSRLRYIAGVYAFAAAPPFEPLGLSMTPLIKPPQAPAQAWRSPLYPGVVDVVYPCGAVLDTQQWTISYGLFNWECGLACFSHAALRASIRWSAA